MFIQMEDGKLINLYYLDDVQKGQILDGDTITYTIEYIMVNGVKRVDTYAAESARNTKYDTVITKLVG